MKRQIGRIALLLGMALTMTLAPLYAQGKRGGARGPEKMIERIAEKLDLTSDQRAKLERIKADFMAEHGQTLERLAALRQKMREQQSAGDREAAAATRAEMRELMMGMKEDGKEIRQEIGEILTSEQRAALDRTRDDFAERHHGKKGRGGHCGDRGDGLRAMAEELDLSPEQREEIREIVGDFREEHADEMTEIRELSDEARKAGAEGDREKVEELKDEIRGLADGLRADREKMFDEIKTILTPEQQKKADVMRAEREKRLEECAGSRDHRGSESRRHGESRESHNRAPVLD